MTLMVGSLFAGVGGVCLGFKQAQLGRNRYEICWANEIDEYAAETYRNNFNHTLIEGDVRKVLHPELINDEINELELRLENEENLAKQNRVRKTINELRNEFIRYNNMHNQILERKIDVLLGGFPCQAFSIAGERRGFEDDRGNLFLSIVDLINQLDAIHGKPRVIFLENVKNLMSHDSGNTYRVIRERLEECGYTIKQHVLNTCEYSTLPQNRERIYIVGFLNEEDANRFTFFEELYEYRVNLTQEERINTIEDIINYNTTIDTYNKYYYTQEKYPRYFVTEEEYNEIPLHERKDVRIHLGEQINEMHQFYQVRRGMYVRRNQSGVCPTLTANMGTGGHNVPLILVNDGIRKITPEEAFKLQGFPIGNGYELPTQYNGRAYSDAQLYKQAGNAVSVPIIKLLAEKILEALQD